MEALTGWRAKAAAITRAALVLAGLMMAWLDPFVAEAGTRNPACGGPLERHCCTIPPETFNLQACDSGLVSIIGGPGAGLGPPVFPLGPACSLGTCYSTAFPAACGGQDEPACTLSQHYQECQSGFRNSGGTCRHLDYFFPAGCGHENQAACNVIIQVALGINSCQSAFREVPFPGGTCVRLDADGFPDFCGGDDERPCNLNEHIPSCKVDLEERDTHPTSGGIEVKCLDAFPAACGRNGQRPCTIFDDSFLPAACKNELRPLTDDFGVCGTDPKAWGETDAHEAPRGRPRTVFAIHGRSGDLLDFADGPGGELFRRMLLETPNIRKVYGVDWNHAGAPPRKLMTRELRIVDPSCRATPATCSFTTDDRNWGAVEFDYTNFKITEVAQATAEAIKTLPVEGDITIVAYSFGGAMARQLVYRHYDELRKEGKRIVEVVTIAVPHRGGLAGDLSLADGRSAELQRYFACLRIPPFFDAESDHTGCELGTWVDWMKKREDGVLAAPSTPFFIDNRGYPQVRWITLAANRTRLDLGSLISSMEGVIANPLAFALHNDANEFLALMRDWHEDSTVVPFPDSDGTITVRSAFGIASDECYPFHRALPPSGTWRAEVVPETRHYVIDGANQEALSAVCYHQGARVDPRVKEDADYASCVDEFPEELCGFDHTELAADLDLQAFFLASLSLLGDTNGDGVVDANDLRAQAGPDRSLECSGALTEVTLDASGSFVPGAVPLTYTWSGPFGSVSGANATVALPVGQHALTLEIAGGGHRSTDEIRVTIGDTTPPQVGGVVGYTVEATAVPGTPFAFSPEASDLCGPVTVQVSPDLSLFPLGSTGLTVTATDASGNAVSAVQTVTVVDTTLPTLMLPPDVVVTATGGLTPVDLGTATATDIFGATVSDDGPASFPVGLTLVTWTAVDGNGNQASATQRIKVVYRFDGFSGPIQPGGVYKADRTLPLKFRLSFAGGTPATTAVAQLSVAFLGAGAAPGDPLDVDSTDDGPEGNVFRYTGDHYHLNVNTRGWHSGWYRLSVALDDGRGYTMDVALR